MGEKAPQRYGRRRRRRRRRRTAEEGQKYAEIKKGESEAPLLPYPPRHTRNSNGELLLFFLPHQRTLFFSFSFACLQFCSWKYTGKGGMWMWGLLFPPLPLPPFHSTHVSGRKSGGLGRSGLGRDQRFQRGAKFHVASEGEI